MNGARINPSKSISIGEHVWIGNRVIITKGVSIPNDCVVGTGAIVTHPVAESHSVIAGVPAKVVKHNINWDALRLKTEQRLYEDFTN